MRLEPQHSRGSSRINPNFTPPCRLIAATMDLAMMAPAQRHREFVADLAAKRPALREAQVMRIRRLAAANQTRLLGHVSDVVSVTNPARLGEGEGAFVDAPSDPLRRRVLT